jgi:hypothetical protein
MTAKDLGNLSLGLTCCFQGGNLVSFFSGKLCVVLHRAPLTLVGERSREPAAAILQTKLLELHLQLESALSISLVSGDKWLLIILGGEFLGSFGHHTSALNRP